jgi:hypothetical protein
MEAEAEAVTAGNRNTDVGSSGGNKTTAATAMVGAQTRTIDNQLKAAAATAKKTTKVTVTATRTTMMATMVAVKVGGGGGGRRWQWKDSW